MNEEIKRRLIEKIADLEHERWMESSKTLLAQEKISQRRKIRWGSYLIPYKELSEELKEKDRILAKKILNIILEEIKKHRKI